MPRCSTAIQSSLKTAQASPRYSSCPTTTTSRLTSTIPRLLFTPSTWCGSLWPPPSPDCPGSRFPRRRTTRVARPHLTAAIGWVVDWSGRQHDGWWQGKEAFGPVTVQVAATNAPRYTKLRCTSASLSIRFSATGTDLWAPWESARCWLGFAERGCLASSARPATTNNIHGKQCPWLTLLQCRVFMCTEVRSTWRPVTRCGVNVYCSPPASNCDEHTQLPLVQAHNRKLFRCKYLLPREWQHVRVTDAVHSLFRW